MALYDIFMFPLETLILKRIRKQIIPKANGNTLEIAFGTGVNMPYYKHDSIETMHALDVYKDMKHYKHIKYYVQSAEDLPFEDGFFDSIVVTLALCSIPNLEKAISEIKRCLKDDGIYIFLEHQQAQSKLGRRVFNKLNPLWSKHAGGCRINLNTSQLIRNHGFKLQEYNFGIFHYGIATKV